jgi:Cdc6-like AAA superfamily ATPase
MVGTEAQLRSRLERDGYDEEEIEDILGDRADELHDRQRDDLIIERLQQRESQ